MLNVVRAGVTVFRRRRKRQRVAGVGEEEEEEAAFRVTAEGRELLGC